MKLLPRRGGDAGPGPVDEEILTLPPSRLRKTEPLYGYVVGAELVFVSILNLTVTGGAGAPKHPSTTLSLVGLLASVAFTALLLAKNRTIAAFAALVAAFFATYPRVPSKLSVAHIFALVIPLIYALVLTQRQRRATTAQTKAGISIRSSAATGTGAAAGAAAAGRGRRGRKNEPPEPTGPRPNRRYTPPKAKRDQTRR